MSGSHLVLVTIHGRFNISIEQDKIELVTLDTIFGVVWASLIINSGLWNAHIWILYYNSFC